MTVLVVGASGFLGSQLVRALRNNGRHVVGTTRAPAHPSHITLDLLDGEAIANTLDRVRPSTVVNLAGAGLPRDGRGPEAAESNVVGSRMLAQAVLECRVRPFLIHAGSALEDASSEVSEYSLSKAAGTEAVAVTLHDVGHLIVRIHSVYGPTQPRGRFLSDLIDSLLAGAAFTIQHPERSRDFCFVDDVVGILSRVSMTNDLTGVHEIGSGVQTSLRRAAVKVVRILGVSETLLRFDTVADGGTDAGDGGQRPLPSLLCRTPLDQGLLTTVRMRRCGG